MTELEEKILKAYGEQEHGSFNMGLSFDGVDIKQMSRNELELLCAFLGSEFMNRTPKIEVSLKIRQ